MPASAEEIESINYVRAVQRRPPLASHEVAALTCEAAAPRAGPTVLPPPSPEEQQALAYRRQLQCREVAEGRPGASGVRLPDPARRQAPVPSTAPDALAPVPRAASGPAARTREVSFLTGAEDEHLARLNRERRLACRPPLSAAEVEVALAEMRRAT